MPANYYHLLRRQMLRTYRKPLILATPKIGLKHPQAVSKLAEFVDGTKFNPIYTNVYGKSQDVKKVILCSGRLFFDIEAKFQATPPDQKVMVIRLEELAPFPAHLIEEHIKKASPSADVFYFQEECMNEGAF